MSAKVAVPGVETMPVQNEGSGDKTVSDAVPNEQVEKVNNSQESDSVVDEEKKPVLNSGNVESDMADEKSAKRAVEPGTEIVKAEGEPVETAQADVNKVVRTDVEQVPVDQERVEVTIAADAVKSEIEKTVGDDGLAFMHLEAGDGGGFDGDEVSTFSAVNRDAADSDNRVEVTEVWYEHTFFDGMAICTAGKLDPTIYLDNNEAANDETTQFLSTAFRNSTALEFPDDNTYGFRAAFLPSDWSQVDAGIFDDNANWDSVFEDPFLFAQINLMPGFLGEGRPGSYRLY